MDDTNVLRCGTRGGESSAGEGGDTEHAPRTGNNIHDTEPRRWGGFQLRHVHGVHIQRTGVGGDMKPAGFDSTATSVVAYAAAVDGGLYIFPPQTVKPQEADMKEPDPESDPAPVAAEPAQPLAPQADSNLQTETQDHNQDVPVPSPLEPVPAQDHAPTGNPAPAELWSDAADAHPSLEAQPPTSPDKTENAPTSGTASQTHTG